MHVDDQIISRAPDLLEQIEKSQNRPPSVAAFRYVKRARPAQRVVASLCEAYAAATAAKRL